MSPAGRKPVTAETRRKRGETDRALPVVVGGRKAPPMPHGFDERMKVCWRYLITDLTHGAALDHADAGVIEAACVMWARARQARAELAKTKTLLIQTPQGVVPNRLIDVERASWKEFRALAESLPLSPWGRARLGLVSTAPLDNDQVEQEIGPSPRKLHAVGNEG